MCINYILRSNNVTTAAEADCIEWQGRYLDLDGLDSGKMVYNNTNQAGELVLWKLYVG